MDIFIDTNVFLSFYHYSSEDLEELKKLSVLLQQHQARLLLPEQVRDEFARNRANKIADAMKRLRTIQPNLQFPQICKEYPEYQEVRSAFREAGTQLGRLQARLDADIQAGTLKADETITNLFRSAELIEVTDEILLSARRRMDLGNPPGKKGSLGDAVNWEALLATVEEDTDIYFVTDDADYCSELGDDAFDPFLIKEWNNRKGGRIIFHKRLSTLFKEKFPQIQLATELEKELIIRELAESDTFAATRRALIKLKRYDDFNSAQLTAIVDAAGSNNQVYWIIKDADIEPYFRGIIAGREAEIEPSVLRTLKFRLEDISDDEYYFGDSDPDDEDG